MKTPDLKKIQAHVANVSISASTLRNQGSKGTVKAARRYLGRMPLREFGTSDRMSFQRALNSRTEMLRRSLPTKARKWGAARKALNIFLRDCFYNKFLSKKYGLATAEKYYELPLDSIVASKLAERDEMSILPKWVGVSSLDRLMSSMYQDYALEMARKKGIARVHLDAYLWRT